MAALPRVLAVHLGGILVGTIMSQHDRSLFAFDEAYLEDANRPILSLGLLDAERAPRRDMRPTQRRLPPYFSNLLPEGRLRAYVAELAGFNPDREFPLLLALGEDLPGAVFVSALSEATSDAPGAMEIRRAASSPLKFSLAGVQLKFSALASTSGGMTIPASGLGGDWILKLPSATHDAVSENEFVMLELAAAIGIDTPERRLIDMADIEGLPAIADRIRGKALAVKRFDRLPDRGRMHQEDFAQVFGQYPEDKYKRRNFSNIATVVTDWCGVEAGLELVRRLTMNSIIGNGDMHLKNWSLIYPDRRSPKLAPAYDYLSTVPYIANETLALNFGGSKDFFPFDRARANRFADKARLPDGVVWDTIRETATHVWEEWRRSTAADLIPDDIRAIIHAHIERSMRGLVIDSRPPSSP